MGSTSGRSTGLPATPRFFKIILDATDTPLRIPPMFARDHGHNLPNSVFLKLPNGMKSTEVELVHVDGQMWMGRGWPDFKRRHSLDYGHLLIFEYDGSSLFNVLIFTPSAVEMNYPMKPEELDDQENDDVVMISRRTTPNLSYRYKKKPKTIPARPVGCRVKRKSTDHGVAVEEMSLAHKRALDFASRLDPDNNPFIIRLLTNSYLNGFSMKLPLWLARPNSPIAGGNPGTMFTDGKGWPVRFLECGRRVNISGWGGFAKDNGLKIGDACIFQMVDKGNMQQQPVCNVVIFRS